MFVYALGARILHIVPGHDGADKMLLIGAPSLILLASLALSTSVFACLCVNTSRNKKLHSQCHILKAKPHLAQTTSHEHMNSWKFKATGAFTIFLQRTQKYVVCVCFVCFVCMYVYFLGVLCMCVCVRCVCVCGAFAQQNNCSFFSVQC